MLYIKENLKVNNHIAQISTAILAMKMKEFDLTSGIIPPLFLQDLSKTVFIFFLALIGPKLEDISEKI